VHEQQLVHLSFASSLMICQYYGDISTLSLCI